MTKINFSVSENIKDSNLDGYEATSDQIIELVLEYAAQHKSNNKLDSHYIIPCDFGVNQVRKNANAIARTLILIDLDYYPDFSKIDNYLKASGLKSAVWTTFSHQVDKDGIICDRFRVLLFLNSPVESKLFQASKDKLTKYFTDKLGCVVDASSFTLTQAQALPITNLKSGVDAKVWTYEGTTFDFNLVADVKLIHVADKQHEDIDASAFAKNVASINDDRYNLNVFEDLAVQAKLIEILKTKTQIHNIKTHYAGSEKGLCRQMIIANLICLGINQSNIIELDSVMKSWKRDASTFAQAYKGATAYTMTYAGVVMKLLTYTEKEELGLIKHSSFTIEEVADKHTKLKVGAGQYLTSISDKIEYKKYKVSQLIAAAGVGKSQYALSLDEKIVFAVPTRVLAEQLSKQLAERLANKKSVLGEVDVDWHEFCYYADTARDFEINKHKIIVTTHASFNKLCDNIKDKEEYTAFIDESHSLVTTATDDYRYSSMNEICNHIVEQKFKHIVLLTATPVVNKRIDDVIEHTFLISSEKKNNVTFNFVQTDKKKISEVAVIEASKATKRGDLATIFINDTAEAGIMGNIVSMLQATGIDRSRIAIINAKTKNSQEYENVTEGDVSNCDVIITTSLLVEGLSIEDTRDVTVITIGHWGSVQNIQIANRFRKSKNVNMLKIVKKVIEYENWGLCAEAEVIKEAELAAKIKTAAIRGIQKTMTLDLAQIQAFNFTKAATDAAVAIDAVYNVKSGFEMQLNTLKVSNVIYEKNKLAERNNWYLEASQIIDTLALTGQQWEFELINECAGLSEDAKKEAKAFKEQRCAQLDADRNEILTKISEELVWNFGECYADSIKSGKMSHVEGELRYVLNEMLDTFCIKSSPTTTMSKLCEFLDVNEIYTKRRWNVVKSTYKISEMMKAEDWMGETLRKLRDTLIDKYFDKEHEDIQKEISATFFEVSPMLIKLTANHKFGTDQKSSMIAIAESLVLIKKTCKRMEDGKQKRCFEVVGEYHFKVPDLEAK